MRVEDPVTSRGGLNLGLVLILNQNPVFEMASSINENSLLFSMLFIVVRL
jgi:hypothetical protein